MPGVSGIENLYAEHMSRYMFAARLVGDAVVLDLGCGCGYGARHLAGSGASDVLGVDIAPEAVSFAQSRYGRPGLAFAVMDARSLALAKAFSVVTCFEVIEHVDDAARVLAEVSRVLVDDGVLLVSTPDKSTYVAGGVGGSNPFHVREYTRGEFEDLLRSAFPHVRLLDQIWSEGIMIGARGAEASASSEVVDLAGEDGQFARHEPADATYFIAACGRSDRIDLLMGSVPRLFVDTGLLRYHDLKTRTRELRLDLDRRAAWTAKLNEEVQSRDATIQKMKARLAELEKAYDERGAWARGLSQELDAERARLRELQARMESQKLCRARE